MFRGKRWFLSNFYVEKNGVTNEHRFQAAKATSEKDRAYVMAAPTAKEAKRRGRSIQLRADWEAVKIGVMEECLRVKFSDPDLMRRLLATRGPLVEVNNWGDSFWGVCRGKGENHLGKLLMKLREEYRKAATRKGGVVKVFISGSRSIKRLPEGVVKELQAIIDRRQEVLVGDCYGIDTLVQEFFAARGYRRVCVHHIGERPRNNVGCFPTASVPGDRFWHKDIVMAKQCNRAVAIWDGESRGTKLNLSRLRSMGKDVITFPS